MISAESDFTRDNFERYKLIYKIDINISINTYINTYIITYINTNGFE